MEKVDKICRWPPQRCCNGLLKLFTVILYSLSIFFFLDKARPVVFCLETFYFHVLPKSGGFVFALSHVRKAGCCNMTLDD